MKLHRKTNILFLSSSLLIMMMILWYFFVPTRIRIAAGKSDSDSYKFAIVLKNLVEKNAFPRIQIEIESGPDGKGTDGTQENLDLLKQKKVDFAMAQADLLAMPESVREELNLPSLDLSSTRLVSILFPDAYQLIVRGDAGINDVDDLRRKRVMRPPEQGGQIQSFYLLAEHYGLSPRDYQFIPINQEQNNADTSKNPEIGAFCRGDVQAIFHVRAVGHQKIRSLLNDCPDVKAKLLPIDEAGALKLKNPYLEETKIPKGAYRSEKGSYQTENIEPNQEVTTVQVQRLLLTDKDVNPDVVRRITEVLYEYRQDFIQKMELPLAADITPPDQSKIDLVATHRGAQLYYDREQPSWLQENSGTLEVLLGITLPMVGWFWWLLQQLEQARKDKADDYIRETTALIDAKDCLNELVELGQYQSFDLENNKLKTNLQVSLVIDKIAKILVEKYDSEIAQARGLISQESVISFSKTLRKVVKALEQSHSELANYIFTQIPNRATEVGRDRKLRQSKQSLIPAMIGFNPHLPTIPGFKKPQVINQQTYQIALNHAKTPSNSPSNRVLILNKQFLESETQLIRDDLEVIFKRAVNALVEERISQDSFQTFRGIWQIAIEDVDRVNSDLHT